MLCDMAPRIITGPDEVKALAGQHVGYSEWLEVTQERVNLFAEATGDHQWIHVNPERAAKESPFGGPIAHGYLTLSLAPALLPQIVQFHGFSLGVNYGCDKVRFTSPVPVGAKLRMGLTVASVEEITGGLQNAYDLVFETEGASKPSCVARVIYRMYL